jgi:bifunctional DNA primase/polymerase-like protein
MTLADHADRYAALGWHVFPLQVRAKKPYGNTAGLKDGTNDPGKIRRWWLGQETLPAVDQAEPAARPGARSNIGLRTGAVSGFWVLDEDGAEASAGVAALEAVHGALPRTPAQRTANGRHRLFACPPDLDIKNSSGEIGTGIDVRGTGGYIVAPPSIHPGDVKKGVPPGRVYAWEPGCAPWECELAIAPDWLVELARRKDAPAAGPSPAAPARRVDQGQASAYGEAALSGACRDVETAPAGRQNSTLWERSCNIGCLVAGGEIQRGYAERELVAAGLRMSAHGKPWTLKVVADTVSRAFEFGEAHPRSAPDRRGRIGQAGPARRVEARPTDAAAVTLDAMELWAASFPMGRPPGDGRGCVPAWFRKWGLDPGAVPEAWAALRYCPVAPWNAAGESGPALVAPLQAAPGTPVHAVAILPMHPGCARFAFFLGDAAGKAAILTPLEQSEPSSPLIVALDLQDAWVLAGEARESGLAPRVAITPTIRSFAGQALGDRFGRLDPDCPSADPAQAPWTWPNGDGAAGEVVLALRRDLRPVEVRTRKMAGGTRRQTLSGEAAARFYGALADQAWRRSGANRVRMLLPTRGDGFNDGGPG